MYASLKKKSEKWITPKKKKKNGLSFERVNHLTYFNSYFDLNE